ncbi:protein ACCELERATED CELL DEATH 6-like [Arachis stenosperma]|uniref:protein ACCELERATED CELL DEATH 6-like n=1 Tax=Arachis stenosperma TaxID=217475 RepID=UPI0025ABD676|nr:protein ACCELERATED CELL DEATH 6-like [Arachis stenosperma]
MENQSINAAAPTMETKKFPESREREMADVDSACVDTILHQAIPAQFRCPNLVYLGKDRDRYLTHCVPLHKAALKGDWKKAKKILEHDELLLTAAITKGWATPLHVAVGANHVHIAKELVQLMQPGDLELQDNKGNTAFCFAAAVGNVQIAEIMRRKNDLLPQIRVRSGMTPLHLAAMQGRSEMAWYLFPQTKGILQEEDWISLFFICINSGLFDLALEMLNQKDKPISEVKLATARGDDCETGLHVLARKLPICSCQSQQYGKGFMHFCKKDTSILKLTKRMWQIFLTLEDEIIIETITEPSQAIFIAAEVGNFEFLSVLLSTYPDLIWELDTTGRSIIHTAVLHRHASIFNLIHEVGSIKDIIVTFLDDKGNNLLHCAAKLAPPDRLNIVSGAALQMMLELSWFEEVKKITPPMYLEMRNNAGFSPRKLFTMEHEELLKQGESWMKRTAESCMVVSTLIATGVFSAAFTLPGGNIDNIGSPKYLKKPSFLVFAISDATALISSSASILIFLSILISRYAEYDFLCSLPMKLISGLVTLFISIISMIITFSSAYFVTCFQGLKWIPIFISVLTFVPIPLFVCLQFPLWSDIVYSTYICSSLFRLRKPKIT